MADLQKLRKTPLVLTAVVLEVLKNWFTANSQQFKYSLNKLDTKLVIQPAYEFTPEDCQNRPGLYVKRDTITPQAMGRAGMNDLYAITPTSQIHANLPAADITVFTIGKYPGEVEVLAAEALDVLLYFAPVIRSDFNLLSFAVTQVGGIGLVEEAKEFWAVPIAMQLKFSDVWELTPSGLPLKTIWMNVRTALTAYLDKPYSDGAYNDGGYNRE